MAPAITCEQRVDPARQRGLREIAERDRADEPSDREREQLGEVPIRRHGAAHRSGVVDPDLVEKPAVPAEVEAIEDRCTGSEQRGRVLLEIDQRRDPQGNLVGPLVDRSLQRHPFTDDQALALQPVGIDRSRRQ